MLNGDHGSQIIDVPHDESQERQHVILAKNPDRHLAFPDLCQIRSGDVLVVYRDGAKHVDRSGRIMLVRGTQSPDGLRFQPPELICDTELDDRDPSIVELANGTLLINFFRLDCATGEPVLAIARSSDGGKNWEQPFDVSFSGFPQGLATSDAIVELPSGDLVMAVYGKAHDGQSGAFLVRSKDRGKTWPLVAPLALCQAPIFEEPSIVSHSEGRLIALLRTDNRGLGYIYQTESRDEGYTWTGPERLDLWGYPADLCTLKDGNLLATYGYRQLPTGIRYCQSKDGRFWSIYHEVVLRADGHDGGELGYPSSVEVEPGLVLTVYYYTPKSGGNPFIAGTIFKLPRG